MQVEKLREQNPSGTFAMFERVDRHAMGVSSVKHKNLRDLLWALIYAPNFIDELEKVWCARALSIESDFEYY